MPLLPGINTTDKLYLLNYNNRSELSDLGLNQSDNLHGLPELLTQVANELGKRISEADRQAFYPLRLSARQVRAAKREVTGRRS